MSKKTSRRSAYVPSYAKDAELLRSQGKVRNTPPDSTNRNLPAPTKEQATLLPQERINLDQAMIEFGELIEIRHREATEHMEKVVAESRRIVFKGKEKG
jgi:hypothetical protein